MGMGMADDAGAHHQDAIGGQVQRGLGQAGHALGIA